MGTGTLTQRTQQGPDLITWVATRQLCKPDATCACAGCLVDPAQIECQFASPGRIDGVIPGVKLGQLLHVHRYICTYIM